MGHVRCGNGTKTRARKVVREPKNGGATCPDLEETDVCKTDECKGIFFLCIYVTLFSTLQGETDDTTFTTTFLILTIAGSVLLLTFLIGLVFFCYRRCCFGSNDFHITTLSRICFVQLSIKRWIRSNTFKHDINNDYGIYPENEDEQVAGTSGGERIFETS